MAGLPWSDIVSPCTSIAPGPPNDSSLVQTANVKSRQRTSKKVAQKLSLMDSDMSDKNGSENVDLPRRENQENGHTEGVGEKG